MRARAAWLPRVALLVSLLLLQAGASGAAEEEPLDLEKVRRERAARQSLYPVRSRISRYLSAAMESVDEGENGEAKALLEKLNPKRLNPYERALVYRMMGFVANAAGDYAAAIENFQKVVDEEVLRLRDESRIRFNIAQLYAAQQQWRETIAALDEWFLYVDEPDPLGYYLLGIAYYQLEEYKTAIENTEKAVDLSPEPLEGWLQLLAALYVQTEDYASATPVLEELVIRFPKKLYWVQLSLIYGARENYRRSLAAQQAAYAQDFLTEDAELRRLARSYLYHDLPWPAARVLDKAIEEGKVKKDAKAFELLANSWIAAREYDKSLPPLQTAARLSEDGNLYVRLGQVHLQREEWKQAAEMLQKAIEKGGVDNPGNAELLLGIAYYNDERVGQARSFFVRARQHDSTREAADRWIAHIEQESSAS